MTRLLAKFPQQRIRAAGDHPTTLKLEQLFDYMDEIGLTLKVSHGKILVSDDDRFNDKRWEIRDLINNTAIAELPCNVGEYKITQDVDVPPRPVQPALMFDTFKQKFFKKPKAKSITKVGPLCR